MRKSIILLLMMTFTLITGVSMHCGAKAPPDVGPKIEQYTADQMVSPAVATVDYSFQSVVTDVFVTGDTELRIRENDIAFVESAMHAPVNYDIDTGQYANANFIFYLEAPPLPFQYCEGRATEYRCFGHS